MVCLAWNLPCRAIHTFNLHYCPLFGVMRETLHFSQSHLQAVFLCIFVFCFFPCSLSFGMVLLFISPVTLWPGTFPPHPSNGLFSHSWELGSLGLGASFLAR